MQTHIDINPINTASDYIDQLDSLIRETEIRHQDAASLRAVKAQAVDNLERLKSALPLVQRAIKASEQRASRDVAHELFDPAVKSVKSSAVKAIDKSRLSKFTHEMEGAAYYFGQIEADKNYHTDYLNQITQLTVNIIKEVLSEIPELEKRLALLRTLDVHNANVNRAVQNISKEGKSGRGINQRWTTLGANNATDCVAILRQLAK